jgi:phosphatidylethanolamine/phosphatidyl-N-methylethanolamine N-methyltransferase
MSKFILQFLRHPERTGAIAASSRALATAMVRAAPVTKASTIVELGPGTGVFTEQILKKRQKDSVFFAMELNPVFVAETKRRCPSATVYHDSAINIRKYIESHGRKDCDCIISSLPWGMFDRKLQIRLIHAVVDALRPDGEFLTYSYLGCTLLPAARKFRHILNRHFGTVYTTPFVWRNLPPAFIYHCRKH